MKLKLKLKIKTKPEFKPKTKSKPEFKPKIPTVDPEVRAANIRNFVYFRKHGVFLGARSLAELYGGNNKASMRYYYIGDPEFLGVIHPDRAAMAVHVNTIQDKVILAAFDKAKKGLLKPPVGIKIKGRDRLVQTSITGFKFPLQYVGRTYDPKNLRPLGKPKLKLRKPSLHFKKKPVLRLKKKKPALQIKK